MCVLQPSGHFDSCRLIKRRRQRFKSFLQPFCEFHDLHQFETRVTIMMLYHLLSETALKWFWDSVKLSRKKTLNWGDFISKWYIMHPFKCYYCLISSYQFQTQVVEQPYKGKAFLIYDHKHWLGSFFPFPDSNTARCIWIQWKIHLICK